MFNAPYLMSLVPTILDMIDRTIGLLRNPLPTDTKGGGATLSEVTQEGYAFIAMPIDNDDHQLVE